MRKLPAFLLAITALGAAPAAKPVAADGPKLDIPFEKYELANGLEVILHQDRRLPIVAVNVWYHVGAFHERPGRTGFAHLFEHMMFQGSAHVRDKGHFRTLEAIGASEANGTTDFDRTNYFETVPSNRIETALWLESDRMGFLLDDLTPGKLANQKDVVINERRQGIETAPYGLAEEKLWHALFPLPHPYYGEVIGSMADLEAATLDDVKLFFRTWYAPANATLVIAGDFDAAEVRPLVEKYFASLPSGPRPAAPEVGPVAIGKQVVLTHDETVGALPRVMIDWHSPAFFAQGDSAGDLLAAILASGEDSLLEKRLIRELELAQSVESYQQSLGAQSVFHIDITGRQGVDPHRLLAETDASLAKVRAGAVTAPELARAMNRYETRFVDRLQRLGGFGGRADMLQTYNHYFGDPGHLADDVARYRAVTLGDLSRFATDVLADAKRVVMIAVPAPRPAAADAEEVTP
jgi:zinc protease